MANRAAAEMKCTIFIENIPPPPPPQIYNRHKEENVLWLNAGDFYQGTIWLVPIYNIGYIYVYEISDIACLFIYQRSGW